MNPFAEYKIPFIGLKEGLHVYDFQIGESFFSSFEFGEIQSCDIKVTLELHRSSNMMQLDFTLEGIAHFPCDRCSEMLQVPLSGAYQQIIKFGDETDLDEEIIVFGPAEHIIEVQQWIYEFAHLSLPLKRVHENLDDCIEVDFVEDDAPDEEEIDPRWSALKGLK